jgi:hypothetical protein
VTLLKASVMDDTPEESPTLGEKMNRGLYLDPGFTVDRPGLVDALRDDIDDTTRRAQANLDQQRQNAADVDLISKELAREAHQKELDEEAESADEP